jgi:hypothetical protein
MFTFTITKSACIRDLSTAGAATTIADTERLSIDYVMISKAKEEVLSTGSTRYSAICLLYYGVPYYTILYCIVLESFQNGLSFSD